MSNKRLSWSLVDKGDFISYDGLNIAYTGDRNRWSLIRTSDPISFSVKCFYFEVKIIHPGSNGYICVGLTENNHESRNGTSPGDDDGTIGYKD